MPLVRYEIRNEHSLANPQLYRTAAKDDPEGLLEGVAMAGLVGIVRQLGDLAEFAAEVFRDLHEQVMATASRGHELLARVQQLEAEMPAVEKALLSETNQLRFAYTPGADWHASIRYDQNHCTQGDLPRFIRHSYEECRGPPRLFLLDKFDVAGAGACLKRYTDPSFFRTEWASSELMKAERVQRDKKARREKKKGRRRKNGDVKDSIAGDHLPTKYSKELAQSEHPRIRHLPLPETSSAQEKAQENVNLNQQIDPRKGLESNVHDTVGSNQNAVPSSVADTPQPVYSEIPLSQPEQGKDPGVTDNHRKGTDIGVVCGEDLGLQSNQVDVMVVAEDGGSEGEQFVDALATMESELDSESESRFKQDRDTDADRMSDMNDCQSQSTLDLMSCEENETSTDRTVILPKGQTKPSLLNPVNQDSSDNSRAAMIGAGVNRLSPSPTSLHVRRHSMDSISSANSRNAKHSLLPSDRIIPSNVILKNSAKETAGPLHSSNPGVMVSKMVAVFERVSLEQIHDERTELSKDILQTVKANLEQMHGEEKEEISRNELPTATILEPFPLSTSQSAVNDAAVNISKDDKFESSSSMRFLNPYLANSENGMSNENVPPFLGGSSIPLRIKINNSSPPSQNMSIGSLDSSPISIFSALHSPTSPVRTSWTILSSPDSQRLGFASELICPGSPTSVPVLALSPTSKTHSPFSSVHLRDTEPTQICSFFEEETSTPSSISSVEPSSQPPCTDLPGSTAASPTQLNFLPHSAAFLSLPAENSEDHVSLSPASSSEDNVSVSPARSSDDLPSSGPAGFTSDFSTLDNKSLETLQELDTTLVIGMQNPIDKSEQSGPPKTQNVESGILPLGTLDGENCLSMLKTSQPGLTSPPFFNIMEEQPPTLPNNRVEAANQKSCMITSAAMPSQDLLSVGKPLDAAQVSLDPPSKIAHGLLQPSYQPLQTFTDLPRPTPPSSCQREFYPPRPTSSTLHERSPPPPPVRSPPLPSPPSRSPPQISIAKPPLVVDVQDKLLEAITTHDKNTLKKVKTMQNPSLRSGNDRSHLLEQIRAQSFNLRHTVVEKLDPPLTRPVTNISVAAILEKANAIRQAFAGSDEDDEDEGDDWSDM